MSPAIPAQPAGEPAVDEALAAAIVATILAARTGGAAADEQPAAVNRWNDRTAGLRKPLPRGRDAWRFSLR